MSARKIAGMYSTGCPTGKRGYVDRQAARVAEKRARLVTGRMRPYLCKQCGAWHLGHLPRSVVRGTWGGTW